MNCRKSFDRNTMHKMFTKRFITTTYKRRREELWFEREMVLMPHTQEAAQREKTRRQIVKEIAVQRIEHQRLTTEIQRVNQNILNLQSQIYDTTGAFTNRTETTMSTRCAHSDCRGYLSTAYKCGTCDQYTCPECLEPKAGRNDPDHVCDPDKVSSVKLIRRECKPCPSCSFEVFRTGGCSQMFCVNCKSLFDWNTGRPLSSVGAHNPHYIQWLRENGNLPRDVGDIVCGGFPDIRQLNQKLISLRHIQHLNPQNYERLFEIFGTLQHVHYQERPLYPITWNDDEASQELRVLWLLKDLTTEEFKVKRQRLDKRNMLRKEIGLVMEMLVNACTDIFQRFVSDESMILAKLFDECERVRIIFNEQCRQICVDFNNSTPNLFSDWSFIPKFKYQN
jgi:hypothetical protein